MFEPERPHGRTVVAAHFLLLRIEAHALADDGLGVAGRAPDGEGTFEAHGLHGAAVGGAFSVGGFLAGRLIKGFQADEVRRDVAAHVEALHFGAGGRSAPLSCSIALRGWVSNRNVDVSRAALAGDVEIYWPEATKVNVAFSGTALGTCCHVLIFQLT